MTGTTGKLRWIYCIEHEIIIKIFLHSILRLTNATEKIDSTTVLKIFALIILSFKKNLQIVADSYLKTATIVQVHTYSTVLWYGNCESTSKILKPVSAKRWLVHFCSFRYRTDWMPDGQSNIPGFKTGVSCWSILLAVEIDTPVLRIREVYPGSRILIFTRPGSRIQKRGVKKISCHTGYYFLWSQISQNWKFFYFWNAEEIFKRIIELLPKKLSINSQKYGFGIRDPEKTYSGSRIQG